MSFLWRLFGRSQSVTPPTLGGAAESKQSPQDVDHVRNEIRVFLSGADTRPGHDPKSSWAQLVSSGAFAVPYIVEALSANWERPTTQLPTGIALLGKIGTPEAIAAVREFAARPARFGEHLQARDMCEEVLATSSVPPPAAPRVQPTVPESILDLGIGRLSGTPWPQRLEAAKTAIRSRDIGLLLALVSCGLLNLDGKRRPRGFRPEGWEIAALLPATKFFDPHQPAHRNAAQAAMDYFAGLRGAGPWALLCYLLLHHYETPFSYQDLTSLSPDEMAISGWITRLQAKGLVEAVGYRRFCVGKNFDEHPANMSAATDLRP